MEKPYYQSIVDTLKSVKRPGLYAAGGEIVMPLPAISLAEEPDIVLGLPLCEAQAKHLIELASRAPFGRGEQTIIDTSVRCTWQLNPTQFSITNPKWEKKLQLLLPRVKTELGCDNKMKVTCQLYKLLLYEPGGHFKKHRDTEKVEGMFGTLVIQLPSNYSGGKLIVYHQGMKSEFDYSGPNHRSDCYFTSFYADCQHEVEKVTKGYRLCLVYNLMYQGLDECPTPADNQTQASTIVSAMKQWLEDLDSTDCPDLMCYLLEHRYCEVSLSFKLLKNRDRAVADVLTKAKAEVNFDVYIGHINLTECWAAENYGDGDYEEIECCEECVSVRSLKGCDGEHALSEVDIDKKSFVSKNFFETIDPDENEFEEATGNEGASVDKQYNWTALLLWPTRKRPAVIGVSNMVELFKQDINAGKKGLVNVARDIIREMHHKEPSIESCLSFLHSLQLLADTKLIVEMLDVIAGIKHSYSYNCVIGSSSFCDLVLSIASKHGWDILKSPLQTMFARCSSDNVEKYCTFLSKMTASKKPDEGKDLCKDLLSITVKVLADEKDATPTSSAEKLSWYYRGYPPPKGNRSKEFVSQLFGLLTAVESNDLFTSTVSALCAKPVRYPVLETLGPAIVDFYKSTEARKDGPLQAILTYCISQLEVSLRKVIAAPTTNTRRVRFTCSCKDCVELKRFLKHPTEVQHRFKLSKGRRQHLQQQLHGSRADATYVTDKSDDSHTLVVTKNNASYEKKLKKQQSKQALLASLRSLLPVVDASSESEPPVKKQKGTNEDVSGSSSRIDTA